VHSPRTIDKYELEQKLGEGGFGVVYKARHRVTRMPVAIKILTAQTNAHPDVATRFRREASIGNEIGHENIVRAIDFGEVSGQPYLVLEFVDGASLADEVRAHGPMAPARGARIALQVAEALAAAHANGVVHRDLKPENILLVRQAGRDDFVKVLDFGIAKLTAGARDGLETRSQVLIGSPVTMSPEQCRGADIDHRSDIYALGVVLFFAVTGRYPFFGAQGDVLSMHLRDPPPRVSDVRPGVPAAVEAVVERALAKDPAARFQSMGELARALAPLTDEARTAAATVELRRRRPRRRRWLLAAGALLVVAGAGGWLVARRSQSATPAVSQPRPHAPAATATHVDVETTTIGRVDATVRPQEKSERAPAATSPRAEEPALRSATNDKKDARTGYLTIAVLPFAEVIVDGHVAGTTPLRNLPLRPGAHTVELVNAGLHRRTRRTEHIDAGGHRRIQLDWSN
jgi:serine/threonine-protein kinase